MTLFDDLYPIIVLKIGIIRYFQFPMYWAAGIQSHASMYADVEIHADLSATRCLEICIEKVTFIMLGDIEVLFFNSMLV